MRTIAPSIAMLGIGTAVPAHKLDQLDTAQRLAEALRETPDAARWARRLFKQCGVQTRYTCEPALLEPAASNRYFAQLSGLPVPATSQRMATYKQASVPLALRAASAALADARVSPSALTHLLTVSCTGQFLPGLDAELAKTLGLKDTVNRIPLTFLGCAAGLKAIGLARDIASGQQGATVLVVCVELCTLHIQPSAAKEALFGASFFGDGASACVIGASADDERDVFELGKPTSALLPEGEGEMVWEVGDHGFDLYLSSRIPALIGRYLPERLDELLGRRETWPGIWAIHPGGKGIIDALEAELGLDEARTGYSRGVLRDFGNMSSATLLFVLDAIRAAQREKGAPRTEGVCLAFGPGLSCELLPIAYRPVGLRPAHSNAEPGARDGEPSGEARLASHV
ncbi:type III polyketide synthase [Cohnella rhizosphaerae]|uniref:Type III polyketide synthase n=1 Tax=Cohnella rhizosphaerae TaxID=1457232 RepID=A0A9X4KXD8_9BACL|nr:type III polyketide synthase [Cohnella rhizosphaerae]MDG0812627.1 type III polyketide synthase [Cohnella rhizosphaerae]